MSVTIPLPPCAEEDSTNCFWDATAQGNGVGITFATYGEHYQEFEVPAGHHLTDVVFVDVPEENYASGDHFEWLTAPNTTTTIHPGESDDLATTGGPDMTYGAIGAVVVAVLGTALLIRQIRRDRKARA